MDIKSLGITAAIVVAVLVILSIVKINKDGSKKSLHDLLTSK